MIFLGISFFATLVLILNASRLISSLLMRMVGTPLYFFIVWPGVVIHELSHFIGALITLTPIHGLSLTPEEGLKGELLLGKVVHESTSNPFKKVTISGAPFVGGSVALWVFLHALSGDATAPLITDALSGNLAGYTHAWWEFIKHMTLAFQYTYWLHWIFVYCIFSISSQLAPSWHDLKYTLIGIFEISILASVGALFLYVIGIHPSASITLWFTKVVINSLVFFGLTAAVLFFIAALMSITMLINTLARRIAGYSS